MHLHPRTSSERLPHFEDNVGWFATATRSRQEKAVASRLEAAGITNFLPLTKEIRQWSDRKQAVEIPFFSGYVFVHINLRQNEKLAVLTTPGVMRLIGNQHGPVVIPDAQIESLRTILAMRVPFEPFPYLNVGDRVRVVRGMLTGLEGTLIRSTSNDRIVLSIESIQRSISIEISRQDIEPLHPHSQQVFSVA